MQKRFRFTNIYAIAAIAVVGGALFGFDISSMSAIISTQHYLCYFNQGPNYWGQVTADNPKGHCSGPTASTQGGITAAMPGGSWLGALTSGFLTDKFGRNKAIRIGSGIWIIGSAITCGSQGIAMLIVGRVINGFAVGICSAQVPVYISELAPPSKRGRLVGCQQWAITWGILIMFYISYGSSFIGEENTPNAWRVPWGLQAIPAVILLVGLCFMPESPRWLAKHNQWEEAERVVAESHASGDSAHPFVRKELKEIRDVVEFENMNADVTYLELIKPHMIWRTHIGVFTQIWSQLTGMNVMMYYITYVFTMAGLSGNIMLISSSISFVINVVMTIPALLWIDRWGRRIPLLVGGTLMATWMFTTGGLMGSYGHYVPGGIDGVGAASWSVSGPPATAVIATTYLFVASFAPTWGPVSWIYPPELFPLRVRGKAVALCTSSNWAFNFALSYFVPPGLEQIQWRLYMVFGVFCATMTIHVFFAFPETAGKTLEEVEGMFLEGQPAWKTKVVTKRTMALEQGDMESGERISYPAGVEKKRRTS
ncbi:hypothetical protein AJ80_05138 [Polytolypa hystricis UAMH7299]|uniref:Major facilitator superfamily (MFS) profile domain-containing protein n=1 Tax=Polytolypa hystricis (strain UAMH7299) TaxID=1447883 RepID=A0A2B7Y590_POLH7|nr:hypothetical protein AJ80_05138 [Polytolypa hystricis UAMH7299]